MFPRTWKKRANWTKNNIYRKVINHESRMVMSPFFKEHVRLLLSDVETYIKQINFWIYFYILFHVVKNYLWAKHNFFLHVKSWFFLSFIIFIIFIVTRKNREKNNKKNWRNKEKYNICSQAQAAYIQKKF